MNILFVSAYVPSRIRVRPYSFIKALARRGHNITLVCGASKADGAALNELHGLCQRVVAVEMGKQQMVLNVLRALPSALPLQAALNFAPALLEAAQREARSGRFHAAHIEHLRASALGYGLLGVPTVFDSVDCISLLFERALRGSPSFKSRALALLDLARTRVYEGEYTEMFERVIVSSPEDAWALDVLREAGRAAREAQTRQRDDATISTHIDPRGGFSHTRTRALARASSHTPINVIPNGVDLEYFAPMDTERDPATVVFSGKMSYHANAAAALFLVQEIMPLVWQRRPDVQVIIAGSAPTGAVQALGRDARVTVTGFLPDLRPTIARATVAVCPLRYGVGIQNKVLEAMAMSTPVVAAQQTARAVQAEAGHDLLFAERADEYTAAILELIDNRERATALGRAARRYVIHHHDWNVAAARLEELYMSISGYSNGAPSRQQLETFV